MNGPIRRIVAVLGIAFLLLALDLTYWQVVAAERLRQHPENPRLLLSRSASERGQIVSSDTVVLARSAPDPANPRSYLREYPHSSLYAHTVGFASLLSGDSGIEASHGTVLRSRRNLTASGIINALLGDDLRARSIQLSLNHRLQEAAARALGGRRGAVVAIEPNSGQLLAMVSTPSFDPNSLIGEGAEQNWELLGEDDARPLWNRATGLPVPGEFRLEDLIDTGDTDPLYRPDTAFELALRAAAIGQRGSLMRPYVVARVFDADSNLVAETQPELLTLVFGFGEAAALYGEMTPVMVNSVRFGKLQGAGETGVWESSGGPTRVWFSGLAPAERPTVAVAVVVESLTHTGQVRFGAAEVASIGRAVMAAWLEASEPG